MMPNKIAFLSPNFSANAPKKGVDAPHAKFWIAIAIEKSALGQKNSSAIGIWNKPNEDLIAKLISKIKLPPINTGVKIELLVSINWKYALLEINIRNFKCYLQQKKILSY